MEEGLGLSMCIPHKNHCKNKSISTSHLAALSEREAGSVYADLRLAISTNYHQTDRRAALSDERENIFEYPSVAMQNPLIRQRYDEG